MVRAAVLTGVGEPLTVTDIDLPEPGPRQVRVRLAAAGVCHSDLSLATGLLAQPVPAVLGHEGAGTVVAVGAEVIGVAVGDQVLCNWAPSCGACAFCRRGEPYLCVHAADAATVPYATLSGGTPLSPASTLAYPRGTPVYPGLGTGAFAEETLLAEHAVLPLPVGIPLTSAPVLGCAVLTGYGAVRHAAAVRPGESVVVYGAGGVGLSALAGARLSGAHPVICVDASPAKEGLARAQGADEFLVAGDGTSRAIRTLTGGLGADVAIECVGRPETIRAAWSSTRRGGRTIVVGVGGRHDHVSFSALELFYFARTLTGCVFGNSDPRHDIPEIAAHVRAGGFDLDGLITDRIDLAGIPAAFERMKAGQGGRSLVVF